MYEFNAVPIKITSKNVMKIEHWQTDSIFYMKVWFSKTGNMSGEALRAGGCHNCLW